MKVLVCDDIPDRCNEVADTIRQARQDCQCLVTKGLTNELTRLFKTVRANMDNPKKYSVTGDSPFDGVDIVVLDNNLTHLATDDALLTAESIAGYVRAFTKASYIVSLNLNPDVDFDLRFLVGDFSTRADLAINTRHLSNPALWNGNPAVAKEGFLPWYWPRLESVAAKRRQQIEFVSKWLDKPVVEGIGFDQDEVDLLSLHAKGALSPEAALNGEIDRGAIRGIPFDKLTFRDVFLAKDRSLPFKKEREKLSEAEQNGNVDLRDVVARVVAADIDLWFRRDIVAPQEPLVDVPHLLMRFPFLLGNRAQDIQEWNRCAGANSAPYGFEESFYDDHLTKAKFDHDVWVPNACFRWPKLKAGEKLSEYFFEAKEREWADVVFCEDRSIFLERAPKGVEAPTEFPAEFEGAWERRYVARIPDYHYAPRSRFAI